MEFEVLKALRLHNGVLEVSRYQQRVICLPHRIYRDGGYVGAECLLVLYHPR